MKRCMTWLFAAASTAAMAASDILIIEAEKTQFDSSRAEIVERGPTFRFRKGVMLKSGVKSNIANPTGEPDLTFKIQISKPGRYEICSFADTTGPAREAMRVAKTKFDSLRVMIAVDDDFPRNRVLFAPWGNPDGYWSRLMKADFSQGEHTVRIWLPENSALDRLDFVPYRPPKVPEAAQNYVPSLVPPASRPRLWCNAETLPQVRANLVRGENRPIWEAVRKAAAVPYSVKPTPPRTAVEYDRDLQVAALSKAFVYLMTGDRAYGTEAVRLIYPYMTKVEFGNMLDITRELGETIYHGALVYDWCHDLLTPQERADFRRTLLRLADGMEIGWPPFGQTIVNGHGNEAQVNRDLLAMSIALYGEDDVPYRYCSYRILEELVPMRRFEYPCGRHNQGSLYGNVRYSNELIGALLLYRMSGKRVYDESFARLFYYFIYGRVPDNTVLPDGDAHWMDRPWLAGAFTFNAYVYSGDPVFRWFFDWQVGKAGIDGLTNRMRFLLMNDPDKHETRSIATLPLTFFGDGEIPSMIARTGWNFGKDSRDAWVDMKGAGYNAQCHQHLDAGAFQIYYRGWLATDLGMYHNQYLYDFGYNRRSIAHNVMLAYWPEEKFVSSDVNDGGQRLISAWPSGLQNLLSDPQYKAGDTVAADFGPDKTRPAYSYFKTNLAPAYNSGKMKSYTRTFCFLNLGEASEPAALITVDRMTTVRAEYRKYWLFNSLTEPKISGGTALVNSGGGGRVKLQILLPRKVSVETASKAELAHVFGAKLMQPPAKLHEPTANGWRMMFSPVDSNATDLFVAVMQIGDADAEPPPVKFAENAENCQITIGGRAAVFGTAEKPTERPFTVQLPRDAGNVQLLLSDLKPGAWNILSSDGGVRYNLSVAAKKSTAFLVLPGGQYKVSPGVADGAPAYEPPSGGRAVN